MVHVLLGGTGTLGTALARLILETEPDARVRVLARGEHRMAGMQADFSEHARRMSFLIGDVRDEDRIRRALTGANYVYHMAALKHVSSCEYNILEAVRTNIDGTANVVRACIDSGVDRAILVSTDKAVEPTTAYGSTKMVAERVFVHGNYLSADATSFACVRYGNVLASNGSVVQLWRKQAERGLLNMSNPAATRFWWTVSDAALFVYQAIDDARPGDILVPIMAACTLAQLAELAAPGCAWHTVPAYEAEKTHEVLIAPYEQDRTTYCNPPFMAARISNLLPPPPDERRWAGGQLCSADYVSVEDVKRCLSGQQS